MKKTKSVSNHKKGLKHKERGQHKTEFLES
jgi:hypothetical protein